MSESASVVLQGALDRLNAGDVSARSELIDCACERLQRLVRQMLNTYPGVRRWEETGDIFQNSMLRLYRALSDVAPPSLRDFYRLAALQIRRELIDLARSHYGAHGMGANHATEAPRPLGESSPGAPSYEAADVANEPARLALWTEFHQQIEALPDTEREVFDLLWYQGLTQIEAAGVLGVSDRTVKSRWRAARLILHRALGGALPGD